MNVQELTLASLNDHRLFTLLDLAGTFAFALGGGVAARDRGLDWFGAVVIAFTVACGGGVLRDVCIGAVPPGGLTDWRYLTVAMTHAASGATKAKDERQYVIALTSVRLDGAILVNAYHGRIDSAGGSDSGWQD